MNTIRVFLVIVTLFFGSCSYKKAVEKPNDLLSQEQMVDLIAALSIHEAALNLNPAMPSDSLLSVDVFKEKGIQKTAYESSLTYYSKNPETLKVIFEGVLAKLNQMKSPGNQPNK